MKKKIPLTECDGRLFAAIFAQDAAAVRRALADGASPAARGVCDYTPLRAAVFKGGLECIKELLPVSRLGGGRWEETVAEMARRHLHVAAAELIESYAAAMAEKNLLAKRSRARSASRGANPPRL